MEEPLVSNTESWPNFKIPIPTAYRNTASSCVMHSLTRASKLCLLFWTLFPTEISCRGERVRDYYQKQQGYAACQTTKKVSRLECKGGCSAGQCCGPLRSKRRKYSFECTDGSSFVDEVEKVVKCGCTNCPS